MKTRFYALEKYTDTHYSIMRAATMTGKHSFTIHPINSPTGCTDDLATRKKAYKIRTQLHRLRTALIHAFEEGRPTLFDEESIVRQNIPALIISTRRHPTLPTYQIILKVGMDDGLEEMESSLQETCHEDFA